MGLGIVGGRVRSRVEVGYTPSYMSAAENNLAAVTPQCMMSRIPMDIYNHF